MMKEILAKSMLRKHKRIDSWFITSYGINLYRGCTHNCVYCDGRDEKYQVEGEFGSDISVKVNAIDVLKKELDPRGKRKPFINGFFGICGGVSDAYQPFENTTRLCRQTLELLYDFRHPVHILTKSVLVERDLDWLKKINEQKKAIVSFSFSSVDDEISAILEPGVPPPSRRLVAMEKCKAAGLACGMYLMPVIPFITDTREMIENAVREAKHVGADFIVFGGMTLKAGRQKEYFLRFLQKRFPENVDKYNKIYSDSDPWGAPSAAYAHSIEKSFDEIAASYEMPKRIPSKSFESMVSPTELSILILEQLDYLTKLKGAKSPYGYAAYSLSQSKKSIEEMSFEELAGQRGVGPAVAKIIREIIDTKRCALYEKLLR